MNFIVKTLIAALLISFATSISLARPKLAGFIIALPLISMIAILISHLEFKDTTSSIKFARSIFFAVPISLLFFVPFLFADRFRLTFWSSYLMGLALLVIGYFVHRQLPG